MSKAVEDLKDAIMRDFVAVSYGDFDGFKEFGLAEVTNLISFAETAKIVLMAQMIEGETKTETHEAFDPHAR